jgi:hypothetical protein
MTWLWSEVVQQVLRLQIMRSLGGELSYEPRSEGCCFAVVLPLDVAKKEVVNA